MAHCMFHALLCPFDLACRHRLALRYLDAALALLRHAPALEAVQREGMAAQAAALRQLLTQAAATPSSAAGEHAVIAT